MSEAVKAAKALPQLGDRNPDISNQFWVKCDVCSKERWARGSSAVNLKVSGFISRHRSCALFARHGITQATSETLLSGSIVDLIERHPEDFRQSKVICGICGETHYEPLRKATARKSQRGFCKGCELWAVFSLPRGCDLSPSLKRDAIYSKIRRVREALDTDSYKMPTGSKMPFWALTKIWWKRLPLTGPLSPRASRYRDSRHLTLFFEATPLDEIGHESASEFKDFFLNETSPRGGLRSPVSGTRVLETLRCMLFYAKEQGWIEENPFPRGTPLTEAYAPRKSDRLLTVDEEEKILAMCTGDLSKLRAPLIYLVDTAAYDENRQSLCWRDVDFEKRTIKASRGNFIEMTPRLFDAMRGLWEQSNRASWPQDDCAGRPPRQDRVWERTRIRDDFYKACRSVGIEGLKLNDLRRTGAWRMKQSGIDIDRIAVVVDFKDLNNVRSLLEVNPETAQEEINSPRFQEFIKKQFSGSASGNGNEQKSGSTQKRQRGGQRGKTRWDRPQFLTDLKGAILDLWKQHQFVDDVTQEAVAVELQFKGYTLNEASVKSRLKECGVKLKWRRFVESEVYAESALPT